MTRFYSPCGAKKKGQRPKDEPRKTDETGGAQLGFGRIEQMEDSCSPGGAASSGVRVSTVLVLAF